MELKLNGYTDMTQRDDECELGYWLGQPFGGKGYMPEAARESLRHGFEDLFCFLGAKSFMPGIAPPATAQKYRLATLQYGLNLRRYFRTVCGQFSVVINHPHAALDCQITKTQYIWTLHTKQQNHFRGPDTNSL